MTTSKNIKAKKEIWDDNKIISLFMNSVLEANEAPKNVYLFCKENKITEADFYAFFNSIDAVKEAIWIKFFENTIQTLTTDSNYNEYENKNKLLSLYFTFFEILNLNRTYVYFTLKDNKEGIQNLKQLKQLRILFKNYIATHFKFEADAAIKNISKITKPILSEAAWIQFLFILKFWVDDTSVGFEKTDIVIEKAVKATFDILDTTPLELSLIHI